MRDGDIRLPHKTARPPCEAFQAGVCPVMTGRAVESRCGGYHHCILCGATVLVADDDAHMRQLNTRVLERMGLQVLPCHDGQHAFNTIVSHQHGMDVAVLDVAMPGMSGVDVCRALRAKQSDVPVVFATGYDGHELSKTMDDVKANALMTKPFRLEQLRHVVGAMLCSFMGQHLFGQAAGPN